MNLNTMIALICTKGAAQVYADLLESDEGFRVFIEETKNKTREDIIKEYELSNTLGDI